MSGLSSPANNTSDASEPEQLLVEDFPFERTSPEIESGYGSQNYSSSININSSSNTTPDDMSLVQRTSYILACDYVNYRLTKAGFLLDESFGHMTSSTSANNDARCAAMRKMCDEFECRLSENYSNMCAHLDIVSEVGARSNFLQVAGEIFCDGEIRWGRVAAVYVFAGALAIECMNRRLLGVAKNIPVWLATFVGQHLQDWILANGDWDAFVTFSETRARRENESGNTFKKVMTGVGLACGALGVVTLGAILART